MRGPAPLSFDWDHANRAHIARHGVVPDEAEEAVLGGPLPHETEERSGEVMLRIPTDDIDRARRQAADKGIGYQTYIKMLLRAGLDREERSRQRT